MKIAYFLLYKILQDVEKNLSSRQDLIIIQ